MDAPYDRAREDVGNIVHLEHVNLLIPDQRLATLFYVVGLGLTRDPYLMVGTTNMWVNIGRSQMHLPSRQPVAQRVRGTVGLVLPDLDRAEASLAAVRGDLKDTAFGFRRNAGVLEATCPWGNRFRCHAPDPAFGPVDLGMPYVELDVPVGTADRIAAFYEAILGAPSRVEEPDGVPCAFVHAGAHQTLRFRETEAPQPDYDGHHVAIYIADFSTPYRKLGERSLVSVETGQHEWRFEDIVDLHSGETLFTVEHEVRSLTHPLFARPLVNRNPAQTQPAYARGLDAFAGRA
ncbi:MAG: VOC family protein [Thalassobaculum sp.]|uniref:VOC family protein n=1 Tax=Thalassobaculum sp. TaxID=2022740 RepID=UPI0032EBEF9B